MSGELEVDLAVLGGGPGGAAAALAGARHGLTVVLFEPREGPGDKPCGEGIMPPGVDVLGALGLDYLHRESRPFEHLCYVLPSGAPLVVPLPRAGLAIARPALQAALDRALAAEARIRRVRARAEVEPNGAGSARFEVRAGGAAWRARALAVADGLTGSAAAWLRGDTATPRAGRIGLRARFDEAQPMSGVEVHLGRASEIYLTPLAGKVVNAAVLLSGPPPEGGDAAAILARALEVHPAACARLGELVTAAALRRLDRRRPRRIALGGAFLVGDAGGGVDPILGCGVALALVTGSAAGEAAARLAAGAEPEAEARAYARLYRREVRARRALARALRELAPHPRLLGAVASAGRAFPPLVRALASVAAA